MHGSRASVERNSRRLAVARCRTNKDTELKISKKVIEAHCLISEDTVADGMNHEPTNPRRILEKNVLSLSALHRQARPRSAP